jgi:hypothetical protein
MRLPLHSIIRLFLCAVLLAQSTFAFETDQFNLPLQPLADIGDEVSDYAEENLRSALGKINTEILARQNCLETRGKNCDSPEKTRVRLNYLRSEEAVARAVFNLLGAGIIPSTKSGTWMNSHKFKAQPARYKSSYSDSIYQLVPSNYLTISPTVKLYGAQFGTDKIAHFFQQGYTYYIKSRRGARKGLSASEAAKKAIRWGKISEQTYFGTLVSGVYANADLAANYIGMKFYQGLTHEIRIGETVRPPVVQLKNGVWTINENINLRETLLKPFISNHFNEALNSSKYSFFLRSSVRRTVRKKACGEWRAAFPRLTQADFADISQKLKLWHGEDYGFSESENFVTIANTCFK